MSSSENDNSPLRHASDSLQTMRNNFFGAPQEAGSGDGPQPFATALAPDDEQCASGSRRGSLPITAVTAPFLDAPNSSSSGSGMSAAKKYFSVQGGSDDETVHFSSSRGGYVQQTDAAVHFSPLRGADADSAQQQQQPRIADVSEAASEHPQSSSADAADNVAGESLSTFGMAHKAVEEERAILDQRPLASPFTADEEQVARMHAYDEVCGEATWDFLRETAQAVLPDAVNDLVDHGAETVVHTSTSIIPEGVRSAMNAFGSAANTAGHAIEAVPKLFVNVIPAAVMSDDTKKMLFGDFANTLRSFYHTNVLSMPFVMNQAGLVGGILLLLVVSFTSEYATEAFFGAKNQLRDARKVITYGDVPRLTWGSWYPSLNLFYGITHLIGYIAFSASNTRVLLAAMGLTGGGAMAVSLIVPSVISLPLVFIKRDMDQKPYAILSSFIVFVSVICMFTYFPYSSAASIKLWANSASDYFVALGVTVYAFTGLGSCTPIERTMKPRRYVKCLRAAVSTSLAILLAFGLSGFLSYGPRTCSVITVSLQPGPMKTAVSALLFVASIAIIPQQTFPLCELCDRRLLGIRHVPTYWELKPNLIRIGALVVSALAAWMVPYYGLLLSISGALGCGTVGIVVPAALDYTRRARWGLREGRHLFWWEYLIVFGLGLYGCAVVIIGVTFGMYKLWITIQTNASDTC